MCSIQGAVVQQNLIIKVVHMLAQRIFWQTWSLSCYSLHCPRHTCKGGWFLTLVFWWKLWISFLGASETPGGIVMWISSRFDEYEQKYIYILYIHMCTYIYICVYTNINIIYDIRYYILKHVKQQMQHKKLSEQRPCPHRFRLKFPWGS